MTPALVPSFDAEDARAAMARVLAVAGHDLKQPLQVALHSIGLVLRDDPAPAAAGRLALAASALKRLGQDLDDLARFSQIGRPLRPNFVKVELSDLFAASAQEWCAEAQACKVMLRFRPTGLAVVSDRAMLATMLRNLVGNALKFSRRGGRVLVAARLRDGGVVIEVRDNGEGIAPHHLAAIFDAFDRGGRAAATPGLGLGLYIVHETARILRHHVAVRSAPGQGTVFRLGVASSPA